MVTRMYAGEAIGGGARRLGRGWARIGHRQAIVLLLVAGLSVALMVGVTVSRARSSSRTAQASAPSGAVIATGDSIERQRFLEKNELPSAAPSGLGTSALPNRSQQVFLEQNSHLPLADSTVVMPSQRTSQQAQLYAIEMRDTGHGTSGGDGGPCRTPGSSCNR